MQTIWQVAAAIAVIWALLVFLVAASFAAGLAGQWIARRYGHQCPDCDYRGDPVELVIHHALDHPRE